MPRKIPDECVGPPTEIGMQILANSKNSSRARFRLLQKVGPPTQLVAHFIFNWLVRSRWELVALVLQIITLEHGSIEECQFCEQINVLRRWRMFGIEPDFPDLFHECPGTRADFA